MRRIERLRLEALETCRVRGHRMSRFYAVPYWSTGIPNSGKRGSTCLTCGAWVQIRSYPLPNEIVIGGPAVARNCPEAN